jgi:hypothetical protein
LGTPPSSVLPVVSTSSLIPWFCNDDDKDDDDDDDDDKEGGVEE